MVNLHQLIVLQVLLITSVVNWQYCSNGLSGCSICTENITCGICLTNVPTFIIREGMCIVCTTNNCIFCSTDGTDCTGC